LKVSVYFEALFEVFYVNKTMKKNKNYFLSEKKFKLMCYEPDKVKKLGIVANLECCPGAVLILLLFENSCF
jgi:hypothetical protein